MKEVRVMIREYREAAGMTQTFVAKRAGIKPARLSALELGTIKLAADEFLKICVDGLRILPQNFFAEQFHDNESDNI